MLSQLLSMLLLIVILLGFIEQYGFYLLLDIDIWIVIVVVWIVIVRLYVEDLFIVQEEWLMVFVIVYGVSGEYQCFVGMIFIGIEVLMMLFVEYGRLVVCWVWCLVFVNGYGGNVGVLI